MRRSLCTWTVILALLSSQPLAFAEEFSLPQRSASEFSGGVTPSVDSFKSLSPEQQQSVVQRLKVAGEHPSDGSRDPSVPGAQQAAASETLDLVLKRYGADLFADAPSTFAPGDDLAIPSDYVVGPGDELMISVLTPRRSDDYALVVGRDGTIVVPRLGTVSVAGMPFSRLVDDLTTRLKGGATDMRLSIRMGKLRSIKVSVVGHAKKPGSYTISSLSSLSNALMASGGPAPSGSLRDIQVKRFGRVVARFDYYDVLMRGDASRDIRLQSGDILFIPAAGPLVGISGDVRMPAIYELKGQTSLSEALSLAGNITPTGDPQQVQIERYDPAKGRKVLDVNLGDRKAAADLLQDGDKIRVYSVSSRLRNAVFLEGNVERPGPYQYRPNLRVRDLLPSERSLKPESYLEFALIERVTRPDAHVELIPFHLGRALAGDLKENKLLAPEDKVRVYYRWDVQEMPKVRVAGAVNRGGEFRLHPRMTVLDLINLAGGLQDQADRSGAELTRIQVVDNQVISRRLALDLGKALHGDPAANPILEKGDYLLIKPLPDFKRYRTVTLVGEVAQPGVYTCKDGETLFDLIQRAGGFTPSAYLRGAVFTRQSVRRQQEERLQEFIQRLEDNLYRKSAQAASTALSTEAAEGSQEALNARKALIESLKKTKASGRMIVALEDAAQKPHSELDVQLEEGDMLVVPPVINSVSVLGQVYNPTAITFKPGMRVEEYLAKTGGPTEHADAQGIYVVKADGSVLTDQNFHTGWGPWRRGVRTAVLEPGDAIMVPERLTEDTSIRDIRDITQILFQIATTAALTWGMLK